VAYVALGSNLDNPRRHVENAVTELGALPTSHLTASSSLYSSAPRGTSGQQPDYINAVAEIETCLSVTNLMAELAQIEKKHGRLRGEKNAARSLDLDLLLYGEQVVTTLKLTLPHPRLHLRAFVVLPLYEIAQQLRIPGRGRLEAWLPAVSYQQTRLLSEVNARNSACQ